MERCIRPMINGSLSRNFQVASRPLPAGHEGLPLSGLPHLARDYLGIRPSEWNVELRLVDLVELNVFPFNVLY